MDVGVCWPIGGPRGHLDPAFLRRLKQTGASHLRVDVHYQNPDADLIVREARDAGFQLVPAITPDVSNVDIDGFAAFATRYASAHRFPVIEIMNEPRIMLGMSAERYAEIAAPAARAIRSATPETQIVVAGDFLQPDRRGPKLKSDFMKRLRRTISSDLYDLVAIHTYREPGRPDVTRFDTRRKEHEAILMETGKPVLVTEVGWNLRTVTEEQHAEYILRELLINEVLAVGATFIYAHIQDPSLDFGLFRADQSPRPAVARIAQFQRMSAADVQASIGAPRPKKLFQSGIDPNIILPPMPTALA